MSKIPIWSCSYCGNPNCILVRVEDDSPDICPYSGGVSVFVKDEIEDTELIEFIKKYA